MDEKPTDGYWLKMGALAVEALEDTLRSDLTKRRKEIIAEYLGGLLDNAYEMGIRLGNLQQRMKISEQQRGK